MSIPLWIIDAFAEGPFTGNPAAVCLLPEFGDDSSLQLVASEMNLSETAFLVQSAPLKYHLRWFTPVREVTLCGHATLASAHFLRATGMLALGDTVTFQTLSGALSATIETDGILLDFPSLLGRVLSPPPALQALRTEFTACELNRDNLLVELPDYAALLACNPDFKALQSVPTQGVIVTTATGVPAGYDFASRYFAPSCGIDEDPVTGSAHCFLTPYWAEKLGRRTFRALQASARRGVLTATLADDRVLLSGRCVTIVKGTLDVPIAPHKEKAA